MLLKTKGIVLHHIKYSESSVIATIYTEEFGRKSFMINRGRGRGTAQKANILQPLFMLEMDVYYKPNRDIQRVKEFKNMVVYTSIPYHIVKSSLALFIAEVLYKSIREEEKNKDLFEFLFHSIQLLDISSTGISNFHIMFLLQLTKYLGFHPELIYSKENPIFDLQNGTFIPSIPFHPNYMSAELSQDFNRALHLNSNNLNELKITSDKRFRLLEKIIEYYQIHVSGFGKVNSLQILQEVFH
jgi:DNA repair protein RecO (recombination protein O)